MRLRNAAKRSLGVALVGVLLISGWSDLANATPRVVKATETGVGIRRISAPPAATFSQWEVRDSTQNEPECKNRRTWRGTKLDCSSRDMYRLIVKGDVYDLQAVAVALINDNPRNLNTKHKYDLVKKIPAMSGICVSAVRETLLNTLSRQELINKNLDGAIALANTWDVVWGTIGTTKSGASFMADLADRGLRTASKKLAADYAAGKLLDVLQLNPTSAFSDAIRNLSNRAAEIAGRDTAYWALVTMMSYEFGNCYQIS